MKKSLWGLPVVTSMTVRKHLDEVFEWPFSEEMAERYLKFLGPKIVKLVEDIMARSARSVNGECKKDED